MLGAALVGAVFALGAFMAGPLTMLMLVLGAVAAGVAISRPIIGVAIAFVLVPVGNVGLVGVPSLAGSAAPVWVLPLAWVVFIFLLSLVHLRARSRAGESPRLSVALGLYLAAALVAAAIVDDLSAAAPLLRSLLSGYLLFLSVAFVVRTRADIQWVLGGIALAAAIIGALAGYQYVTGYAGSEGFITTGGELVQRATGGLGHPNAAGGFFAMLVPLLVAGAIVARRGRSLYIAALGLAVVGVYVSFSRAALAALFVASVLLLRDRRTLLLVPLLVILLLTASPRLLEERFATATSDGSELATRADFFRTSQVIWAEHPVLGVGLGGFPEAYSAVRLAGKEFLPATTFQPPPDAHNIFLQHLAEQGVIGLLALLGVLTVALRSALRVAKAAGWLGALGTAMLAMLAVFLVSNQFSVTFLEINGTIFVGVLGLLSAAHALAVTREESDGLRTQLGSV